MPLAMTAPLRMTVLREMMIYLLRKSRLSRKAPLMPMRLMGLDLRHHRRHNTARVIGALLPVSVLSGQDRHQLDLVVRQHPVPLLVQSPALSPSRPAPRESHLHQGSIGRLLAVGGQKSYGSEQRASSSRSSAQMEHPHLKDRRRVGLLLALLVPAG